MPSTSRDMPPSFFSCHLNAHNWLKSLATGELSAQNPDSWHQQGLHLLKKHFADQGTTLDSQEISLIRPNAKQLGIARNILISYGFSPINGEIEDPNKLQALLKDVRDSSEQANSLPVINSALTGAELAKALVASLQRWAWLQLKNALALSPTIDSTNAAIDGEIREAPRKLTPHAKALLTLLGLSIPATIACVWYFSADESSQSRASTLFAQCQANDAEACTHLGVMYQTGDEIRANPYVAQALFTRGCALHNEEACGYLGQIYAAGQEVDFHALPDLPGQANYSEQEIELMRRMLLEGEDSRNVLNLGTE